MLDKLRSIVRSWEFISWVNIRKIGENRTVRTAGVWTILVPITAKLLEEIHNEIKIQILSQEFPIHLALPFSWKILFFVALTFMLANILYSVFCPSIIKETQYFRDYAEQRRSAHELNKLVEKIMTNPANDEEMIGYKNWLSGRNVYQLHNMAQTSPENESRILPELYAIVIEKISKTHSYVRILITCLYLAGFCGIALLVWKNTEYVIPKLVKIWNASM